MSEERTARGGERRAVVHDSLTKQGNGMTAGNGPKKKGKGGKKKKKVDDRCERRLPGWMPFASIKVRHPMPSDDYFDFREQTDRNKKERRSGQEELFLIFD